MSESWRDQAAAYALGALDPDQARAFEARLAQDPALRELVDEYRRAAAGIGTSLPERDPPAALRERILRRAAETRLEAGVDDRPSRTEVVREPTESGPRKARDTSVPAGAAWIPWIGLAAAAAGIVWLGLENRALRSEAAALEVEIGQIRASLGDARAELARLDSVAPLLAGGDVRFATLTADGAQPGLRLLWSPERGRLLVAAVDLPRPPEGRTYQLWGIRGSEPPVSLGTFETSAAGNALLTLSPEASAADFDLSAVTEEPAGGSPQPTSQPFLAGEWRSAQG